MSSRTFAPSAGSADRLAFRAWLGHIVAMDWKTFWDRPNAIYVNDRHKAAHYRGIASDLIGLIPAPDANVLDHGCGEALDADRVAEHCAKLYLLDAAPSVRAKLASRFSADGRIQVIGVDDLGAVPDRSLDLIVANSLLQYLSADELDACLAMWRAKLRATGRLVLADVIPPDVSAATDALALLRFAQREGFLKDALVGLVRTALSPYRTLRKTLGLATYAEGDMIDRLRAAGYHAYRSETNLGHNPARMTFIAKLGPMVSA